MLQIHYAKAETQCDVAQLRYSIINSGDEKLLYLG